MELSLGLAGEPIELIVLQLLPRRGAMPYRWPVVWLMGANVWSAGTQKSSLGRSQMFGWVIDLPNANVIPNPSICRRAGVVAPIWMSARRYNFRHVHNPYPPCIYKIYIHNPLRFHCFKFVSPLQFLLLFRL